ncbi:Protein kinase domain-containing protein [Aphelenchoides besseyi]|nr:Protein kinase domain-containing protein [Aphelenchoides besseyi]
MPNEELRQIKLTGGSIVNRLWKVKSKLGEGGCGVVYEVGPNFTFVVMTLLGRALSDIRRACPDRKFSIGTTMIIGLECVEAIKELHDAGFVHRDIKPSNFSIGRPPKHRTVYVYDFGLSRQIIIRKDGKEELRQPRKTVAFKGTVRYASLNVHRLEEYGRHDDLWSLMYSLVEMLVSELPWQKLERGPAERSKETTEKQLVESSPACFGAIFRHLKSLNYKKKPDYGFIRGAFELTLKRHGIPVSAPKRDERTRAVDLKRICDGLTTRCDVDEIGEREFKFDEDDDQGASHVSGVSTADDTMVNIAFSPSDLEAVKNARSIPPTDRLLYVVSHNGLFVHVYQSDTDVLSGWDNQGILNVLTETEKRDKPPTNDNWGECFKIKNVDREGRGWFPCF